MQEQQNPYSGPVQIWVEDAKRHYGLVLRLSVRHHR
jgi:hypothetical protein